MKTIKCLSFSTLMLGASKDYAAPAIVINDLEYAGFVPNGKRNRKPGIRSII